MIKIAYLIMPVIYRRPGGNVNIRKNRSRRSYPDKESLRTGNKARDFPSPLITKYSKIYPALLGPQQGSPLGDMGG
jgi:hypothetical protein